MLLSIAIGRSSPAWSKFAYFHSLTFERNIMHIGSSAFTRTDLSKRLVGIAVSCDLDEAAAKVTTIVTIGEFKINTGSLSRFLDVADVMSYLSEDGLTEEFSLKWQYGIELTFSDNALIVQIGGFHFKYVDFLELVVKVDSLTNDLISDHNNE